MPAETNLPKEEGMPSYAFVRPDPTAPRFVRRWLSVSRDGNVFKFQFELEELLPGRLYIVTHPYRNGDLILREGEVLSRNLELSERLELDPKRQGDEVFLVYPDIYDALRGFLQIPRQYERVELPRLAAWKQTLRWVLELVWAMYDPAVDREAEMKHTAGAVVNCEALVRNPLKMKARDKMIGVSLKDRLGRRNPGRLPPIFWSAEDLLKARGQFMRIIGRRIDERAWAAAEYLDRVFYLIDDCQRMVSQMLRNRVMKEEGSDILARSAAKRLLETADIIGSVHVRPFGPHAFRHTARDLREAAQLLKERKVPEARQRLERCVRAMELLRWQRRLEEVIVALSAFKDGKHTLPPEDLRKLIEEVAIIETALSEPGREEGFTHPILPTVLGHLLEVRKELSEIEPDLKCVYEGLKQATDPF